MNVTQRIHQGWKGEGRGTFSYEKWTKRTMDIEEISAESNKKRERTNAKGKPYNDHLRVSFALLNERTRVITRGKYWLHKCLRQ